MPSNQLLEPGVDVLSPVTLGSSPIVAGDPNNEAPSTMPRDISVSIQEEKAGRFVEKQRSQRAISARKRSDAGYRESQLHDPIDIQIGKDKVVTLRWLSGEEYRDQLNNLAATINWAGTAAAGGDKDAAKTYQEAMDKLTAIKMAENHTEEGRKAATGVRRSFWDMITGQSQENNKNLRAKNGPISTADDVYDTIGKVNPALLGVMRGERNEVYYRVQGLDAVGASLSAKKALNASALTEEEEILWHQHRHADPIKNDIAQQAWGLVANDPGLTTNDRLQKARLLEVDLMKYISRDKAALSDLPSARQFAEANKYADKRSALISYMDSDTETRAALDAMTRIKHGVNVPSSSDMTGLAKMANDAMSALNDDGPSGSSWPDQNLQSQRYVARTQLVATQTASGLIYDPTNRTFKVPELVGDAGSANTQTFDLSRTETWKRLLRNSTEKELIKGFEEKKAVAASMGRQLSWEGLVKEYESPEAQVVVDVSETLSEARANNFGAK